jgi:hypothetical protein
MAQQACRQALALGLDVSGSVDAREYRLQLDGLARALNTAAVRASLLEQPDVPVELMIYEWSGPLDQLTLVPWARIDSAAALEAVIAQLGAAVRRADSTPGTALGVAMLHGARQLALRAQCQRRTLDISGDGKSNLGPRPRSIKPQLEARGITVNALVIGPEVPATSVPDQTPGADLTAYFSAEVILGPGAFVEVASGFAGYAEAMEIKLLRELDGLVLSLR